MPDIRVITPAELQSAGSADAFPMDEFPLKFLAQGDSWFSIGAALPSRTTNLFDKLSLSKKAVAVNCARPGAELEHMTDSTTNTTFLQLLSGTVARKWDGLLLSGLGNDVISACQSKASEPQARRLLLTQAEWGAAGDPARYISEPGWKTFEKHSLEVIGLLLQQRDKGINKGMPIVVHTYDILTPRNSGAGLGKGPWLYKAMIAYGIPESDWEALARELLKRVSRLADAIAAEETTIHVVHTQGTLQPAKTTDQGATLHWKNEIHPTKAGYRLLGDVWEPKLEQLFC